MRLVGKCTAHTEAHTQGAGFHRPKTQHAHAHSHAPTPRPHDHTTTHAPRPLYDYTGALLFDGKVGCWRVGKITHYSRKYTGLCPSALLVCGCAFCCCFVAASLSCVLCAGKYSEHYANEGYFKDRSMTSEFYIWMLKTKLKPRIKELKEKVWNRYVLAVCVLSPVCT